MVLKLCQDAINGGFFRTRVAQHLGEEVMASPGQQPPHARRLPSEYDFSRLNKGMRGGGVKKKKTQASNDLG